MSELAKMRAVAAAEFDKKFPPPSLELPGDEYDALEEQRKIEFVAWWSAWQHMAALASPVDALVAGDRVDAARDVLAERERQKQQEGWTAEHDDQYEDGELCCAAACYTMANDSAQYEESPNLWPWPEDWWKPTTERRNLVKAGALILAEIERLDRAAIQAQKDGQ